MKNNFIIYLRAQLIPNLILFWRFLKKISIVFWKQIQIFVYLTNDLPWKRNIVTSLQNLHVILTKYITRADIFSKKKHSQTKSKKKRFSNHSFTITLKPYHS